MTDQDMFIVGLPQGELHAVHAQTGAIVWEQHPATPLGSTVGAYSNGHILIAYPDGYLRVRNLTDGALAWEEQVVPNATLPMGNYRAWASPAATVAMFGKTMVAVDPKDGTLLWSYRSDAYEMSALAVNEQHLFLAETYLVRLQKPSTAVEAAAATPHEHQSTVRPPMILTRAFDVKSGAELWNTALIATKHSPLGVGAALVECGGIVYLCGNGLYALDAQTGGLLWKLEQPLPHRVVQLAKWHDVVAWISDSVVAAVDTVTHQHLWQEDVRTRSSATMSFERFDRIVASDDQLYLGRSQFNPDSFLIEMRDPLTGAVRGTFPDNSVVFDPQVAWRLQHTGQVFAVPTGTSVYAFDLLGNQLWNKDFGQEPSMLLAVSQQR